jgi:hypothetical protein
LRLPFNFSFWYSSSAISASRSLIKTLSSSTV